jgi:hypothetical protein
MHGRLASGGFFLSMGVVALLATSPWTHSARAAEPDPAGVEFFEKNVRPVLLDQCFSCHSGAAKSLKGELRLDSWEGIHKGGQSGKPAVAPGDAAASPLILAIHYDDKGTADRDPLLMPPPKAGKGRKLSEAVIQNLEQWVAAGAPHPASFDKPPQEVAAAKSEDKDSTHWAFRKPVEPAIPEVKTKEWIQTPIDSFVLAKLEAAGLQPAPPADKRTLIRRAYFDLIGLPPTPEEVAAFVSDGSPEAFAKVVDHLLASPHYGERWGRYWLDVARYSDTKGYVFQEERRYPYAYTYRDWVIKSLNDDLPYDQFLIDQIAADQLNLGDHKETLAAMGFLTLGRRFLNSKPDIIDDRIDVVCRGTMAMTVGCARCHDHKFDPIPTKDYYSLYAIFNNSDEPTDLPQIGEPEEGPAYNAFKIELKKRQAEYDTYVNEKLAEQMASLRSAKSIAAYLMAAHASGRAGGPVQDKQEINRFVLERWRMDLADRAKEKDSVFAAWRLYAALPTADFEAKAKDVTEQLAKPDEGQTIAPLVAKAFPPEDPPKSLREVAERYGELLARYDKADVLADKDEEALRQVLRGERSPVQTKVQGAEAERLLRRDFRDKATALRRKIESFKATNPAAPPRAMILADAKNIQPQRVFLRGSPGNQGAEVKAHFLSCLSGGTPKPFTHGSGRLELARAIASKDNPLTARVMVNRVWLHHFGYGIVRTPSDFGTRADPPTHPELLDWLALRFMDEGWSLKKLHRLILLSSTYQQSSNGTPGAAQSDPDNLLLSHFNRQRLDFEATRDSLIYVSGTLDAKLGGHAVDVTANPSPPRRTVYAFIDRQNLPGVFRSFDFASPDTTSPRRFTTTVPQQALFMMNSPFMIQQVRGVLRRPEIADQQEADRRIHGLYQTLFDREPTSDELTLGRSFLSTEASATETVVWQYGYGEYDRTNQRVKSFTPLAHYTGRAWQGGATLPDPKVGWVGLWADGGHPGDDLRHAAIRRWTSPIDGAVRITGTLAHHDARGDGIHAMIVSSRLGEVASWNVFHSEAETSLSSIDVRKGDILDFVVDCRSSPAYDSFTWAPVIRANGNLTTAGSDAPAQWSAAGNFSGERKAARALSPWEKYVQVLMESNEFVFVD